MVKRTVKQMPTDKNARILYVQKLLLEQTDTEHYLTVQQIITELEKQGIKAATKPDIQDIYMRLINIEIPELEQIVKDQMQPVLVRIVGKNILSGKGFDIIEKMLDRSIGKAEQKTDITTGGVALNIDPFAKIRQNVGLDEKTNTSD